MAEQTINCQIRTTEDTKKRFAAAAEESGVTQGALLASMLDALEVDKFGAAHQSYASTLEAFDCKIREFRDLYKGLVITADASVEAGVKTADAARAAAETKLANASAEIDALNVKVERLTAAERERDELKDRLAKADDELRRRTERVDELEAEREAVKETEARAGRDRAAAAEAETARLHAEARAAAAEAELEKLRDSSSNELSALKAKADADAALAAEKLDAALARRDELAAEADGLRRELAKTHDALDGARTDLATARADLAASRATAEALREQAAFAKQLALAKQEPPADAPVAEEQ